MALQGWAITGQSLTGDETHHLVAGYQSLAYGQNRLNLEHPPLVKLVAALPLLFEDEAFSPPLTVDRALAAIADAHRRPELLRRARLRGRMLVLALFGGAWLLSIYQLGRRSGGRSTGILLALLLTLSLSVLPNLATLQTDVAVSFGFVAVVLAVPRWRSRPTTANAALLGLLLGVALASKYSALLLLPVVALALLWPARRRLSIGRRLAATTTVVAIALAVLFGTYALANRRYDPEVGQATIRAYCENRGTLTVAERLRGWQELLLAVEKRSPLLAQWLLGAVGISIQNDIGVYPSYAFGEIDSGGRWWYFPALLLVKTPVVILLAGLALFLAGRAGRWRARRPIGAAEGAIVATVGIYLAVSLTSSYNLGVRHLLPVLPFLYLPIAVALSPRRRWRAAIVVALLLESLALAPLWMSATNSWWLGDQNPTRFAFAAGNGENRQSFLALASGLDRRGIEAVRVLYPTLAEVELQAYLPTARLMRPDAPVEPGWHVVSVVVEQLVPALLRAAPEKVHDYESLHRAAERWHPLWQEIVRRGEDHGYVAGTFHLYRVPQAVPSALPAAPPAGRSGERRAASSASAG